MTISYDRLYKNYNYKNSIRFITKMLCFILQININVNIVFVVTKLLLPSRQIINNLFIQI